MMILIINHQSSIKFKLSIKDYLEIKEMKN